MNGSEFSSGIFKHYVVHNFFPCFLGLGEVAHGFKIGAENNFKNNTEEAKLIFLARKTEFVVDLKL